MGCCHIYTNIYRCALTRVYYNITYMCACFRACFNGFPDGTRNATALLLLTTRSKVTLWRSNIAFPLAWRQPSATAFRHDHSKAYLTPKRFPHLHFQSRFLCLRSNIPQGGKGHWQLIKSTNWKPPKNL